MAAETVTEKELTELVERSAEAASALIRGDVRTYLGLIKHSDDYTLMAPFGGDPEHGFDPSSERMTAMAQFFQGGEVNLELVQSYTSGDIVVLVVVERQHGLVGGLPDQDWSLRVTLVFRREGSDWQLIHRHADPLTHPMNLERAASLARG
jgi:ketosteroid isomerase-like protein